MNRAGKVGLTAFTAFTVFAGVNILLSLLVNLGTGIVLLISIALATLAGRRAWTFASGEGGGGPVFYAAAGAILLGGAGFVLGFFGPMLLVPSANQGPLLGIFITGPAGVVIGAVAGFVYGLMKREPGQSASQR